MTSNKPEIPNILINEYINIAMDLYIIEIPIATIVIPNGINIIFPIFRLRRLLSTSFPNNGIRINKAPKVIIGIPVDIILLDASANITVIAGKDNIITIPPIISNKLCLPFLLIYIIFQSL